MQLTHAATYFKALGEPIRLRLVSLLVATRGIEVCNCECVDALEEPQSNVSRHLKILTEAGLIRERHDGRWVYYRCAPDESAVAPIMAMLSGLQDALVQEDLRRLRERLALRQEGKCILGVQKRHLLSGTMSKGSEASRRPHACPSG